MSTKLFVPDPLREWTDVTIKGWPIVISHGIFFGSLPVRAGHPLNVSGKNEVHIAVRSYYELTTNLYAWPTLEREVMTIDAIIKANRERHGSDS